VDFGGHIGFWRPFWNLQNKKNNNFINFFCILPLSLAAFRHNMHGYTKYKGKLWTLAAILKNSLVGELDIEKKF
jgi:hypothetical protein